jgi:microsomal dipeptidase-like Zn-dependent dipeptidase
MPAPENQPVQFADFHVHGSFKAYFTGYSVEEKKSPWEPVSIGIDRLLFRTTNRVLGSQSCFSQLLKGRVGLAVIPLYSTERAFPASFLLKLIDLFSKKISGRLFKAIRKNKVTYWQQLDDCWLHLQRAATDKVPGSEQVNFTRSLEDIKQGKMNIVLSMEGAHCFLDSDDDVATPAGMQKIVDRMMLYKKRDPNAARPRVFILNLTHLTRGPFCNHGFGMKLIAHNEFVPRGKGLSAAGIQLIEAALLYDKEHFPFIIDIKHMSLKSRAEYYELRRKKFPGIPVIASHAGCTGISC